MREYGYNSESSTNSKILKTVDGAAIAKQKIFRKNLRIQAIIHSKILIEIIISIYQKY